MSMQLDEIESPPPKESKDTRDKQSKKADKKRKRAEQRAEEASPVKKHRSKKSAQETTSTAQTPYSLTTSELSPFFEQSLSLYLPLSSICQQYPLQGLCAEHLSPLILSYYPPLNGIVLSYSNPKLSERPSGDLKDEEEAEPVLAQVVDEYAVSYVWLTADFLVFRPRRGCRIEGWINLQNESNIGLVCYNYFSASIERKRLPKDWRWMRGGTSPNGARKSKQRAELEDEEETLQINGFGHEDGHFVDGSGNKIEGSITFTVKDMETSRNSDREPTYVSIEGTLLSEKEENELREQDFNRLQGRSLRRPTSAGHVDCTMSGALPNGHVNSDSDVERTLKTKHRMSY